MDQNSEHSKQVIALIKFFSEEEHFLAFKHGCSIFRTPHFFRKHGSIGRGDRNESCLLYWDEDMRDEIPSLAIDGVPVDFTKLKSVIIHPAHEPKDSWMQSWCVMGPHNQFEGSLQRMLEDFGTYFIVLPAKNIGEYAKLLSQISDSPVSYRLIQYSDNPLDRSLGVKDSKFYYQKEFRFYIGECEKDEVKDKEFQLHGLESIFLEAASLKLQSPAGETMYCSLGQKQIVTI